MKIYINIIEKPVITEELFEDNNIIKADDMIENDILLDLNKENKEHPSPLISVTVASN
ncbi:4782_t:CDS:2 [Acaulospora morrowiae]|uniref:4782_t:CDS:1 n=1 Tax=Acaulospora morrowiae TaxID=94023 RepID=A0A9N8VQS1_9GLOM|nr:4782_t:CDS:2 [Acaulospora morrowiae]